MALRAFIAQGFNPLDLNPRDERDQCYLEVVMRVLDRVLPGYAD